MYVAEVYLVLNVDCETCGAHWVAVVPSVEIKLIGEPETKLPERLQCPSCGKLGLMNYDKT